MKNVFSILLISIFVMILTFSCDKKNDFAEKLSEPQLSGVKTVFIKNLIFENDDVFMSADSIQFFTGEKAEQAYREDTGGEIEESTFYIRNKTVDDLKYKLADNVKIIVKTFEYYNQESKLEGKQAELKMFGKLFKNETEKYYSRLPFKITFKNNEVQKIEEIYIP
ncbi:MAG: hypothetical protein HND52_18845 [Ignavibacteriae bacterium]|nr:hypothetical protein [Ignavibacteriota bacterium]NOH00024.1 hypothetical protein [Ignavibacteriota bacterium]